MTMVEMLIALVVLAIGILAVGRMFPLGARSQVQDRLLTAASYHANEQMEQLRSKTWADSALTDGRHPSGTATEAIGGGQWQRFYTVETMASPLDNLKRVDVTVQYQGAGVSGRSITTTTYVRR
jgi:Tfp pilus assembly protein PilV